MIPPRLTSKWIGPGNSPQDDLGIFVYRRTFIYDLGAASAGFWISADQRYRLFLNGECIGEGPQRGDANHWFADYYDVKESLSAGENALDVLVWNMARFAPMAQCSVRTGLFLEGAGNLSTISTPNKWSIAREVNISFAFMHSQIGDYYIDVGPGEVHDLTNGEEPPCDVNIIADAEWRQHARGGTPWMLVPRSIPLIRPIPAAIGPSGIHHVEAGSPLELDYGLLSIGRPVLRFRAKSDKARIRITYAEARTDDKGHKGNRDDAVGKTVKGYQDEVIVGENWAKFEPLWIRTFRFLRFESDAEFEVETGGVEEVRYPYSVQSCCETSDDELSRIWSTSVRTLELCAGETYFDCPYYEQLQYIGDARIQALCGYYLSRDRALQRNAIETLSWSIDEQCLLQSRYPSRQTQIIPPFGLFWVLMVYDAWMHDPDFNCWNYFKLCSRILTGYAELSSNEPTASEWTLSDDQNFWCFADWCPEWRWGVPPGGIGSGVNTSLSRLAWMAYLKLHNDLHFLNDEELSVGNVYATDQFNTEHERALAYCEMKLAGVPAPAWPKEFPEGTPRCTLYFQHYVHEAIDGSDYLDRLGPWRDMLRLGLTTFAETPEPTRSDCHGWSAHPAMGFLRYVAGIRSDAPGWSRVLIEPKPNGLEFFNAKLSHPKGDLFVMYDRSALEVVSPVPGKVIWNGLEHSLSKNRLGEHRILLQPEQ